MDYFCWKIKMQKGYDIFAKTIRKILDNYPEWRAEDYW